MIAYSSETGDVATEVQTMASSGLREYNRLHLGHFDREPVVVSARDASGEVIGGTYGGVFLDWLAIDILWVGEEH